MRAFGVDLGETLVAYGMPLNWKAYYRAGLMEIGKCYLQALGESELQRGKIILERYNTRLNPRDTEVSSDVIFREIFDAWGWTENIEAAKYAVYSYFRRQTHAYSDTLSALKELRRQGVRIGVLTDVPYGMDRKYVIEDCGPIIEHVDVLLASVDVGYRKPHVRGYLELASSLGVSPGELVYTGNEEKDIAGANEAGCISVLIDREATGVSFGECRRIGTLVELVELVDKA